MKNSSWLIGGLVMVGGLLASACSDDESSNGGTPATGGTTATGGATATGGTVATGGTPATGGSPATGGTMGGGGATATGGDTASGGMAGGMAQACDDIPSLAMGDADFTASSDAFDYCEPIPAENTCDGKPFPEGMSPDISWTEGPDGTESYAVVLKDIAILDRTDPSDPAYNRGFHYVIWDIPADVTSLPAEMMGGHKSPDVLGARQWSPFNDYGYFGPCPNFDPANPTDWDDSYSFVVYALPAATTDVPAPEMGISVVRQMDAVFQDAALAVAEHRGTSSAQASGITDGVLPPMVHPPCPTEGDQPEECLLGPGASRGCEDLPPLATGDGDFTAASDAFEYCEPIPAENTCDEKPFADGTSPDISWTEGPEGTLSYAVVLKDLAVLDRTAPSDPLYNRGYHYVIWDIPADVMSLPAEMMGGHRSQDVLGARQWSNFNDYGYFGPCPNFDPDNPTDFDDSYSFVVYALPTATTEIPAPEEGISTVRQMDDAFLASALAVAEHRGTSSAHASEIPEGILPPMTNPPCPTEGDPPDECLLAPGVSRSCEDIPSLAMGDEDFAASSDAFDYCGRIPAENTCDYKPFADGTSPEISWTDGPEGTESYAVVLKDIAILDKMVPADPLFNRGFHYVIWDIPADVTTLPAEMMGGHQSLDVYGARQWSNFNDYGYFGPCPNFDPDNPTDFDDSYSFVVYALPTPISDVPEPEAGISTVRQMDALFQESALAVTEYRGTSSAQASEIPEGILPPMTNPPCPTEGDPPEDCLEGP